MKPRGHFSLESSALVTAPGAHSKPGTCARRLINTDVPRHEGGWGAAARDMGATGGEGSSGPPSAGSRGGEGSAGAGGRTPPRPPAAPGAPGRCPASWQRRAVGGRPGRGLCRRRRLHVGQPVSLGGGGGGEGAGSRGAGPGSRACTSASARGGFSGAGPGRSASPALPPPPPSSPAPSPVLPHPLVGPKRKCRPRPVTLPSVKTYLSSGPAFGPPSGLRCPRSPSDKGFPANLLMASRDTPATPSRPLAPLWDASVLMSIHRRNGGEACAGAFGDIWDSKHPAEGRPLCLQARWGAAVSTRREIQR